MSSENQIPDCSVTVIQGECLCCNETRLIEDENFLCFQCVKTQNCKTCSGWGEVPSNKRCSCCGLIGCRSTPCPDCIIERIEK